MAKKVYCGQCKNKHRILQVPSEYMKNNFGSKDYYKWACNFGEPNYFGENEVTVWCDEKNSKNNCKDFAAKPPKKWWQF
jgi:hypothetical protein